MQKVRLLVGLSLALACGVAACGEAEGDASGSDGYLNRTSDGDDADEDTAHRGAVDGGVSMRDGKDGGRARGVRSLDGGRGRDHDDDSDEASEEADSDKPDGGRRCRWSRGHGRGEHRGPHLPGFGDRHDRDDENEEGRDPGPGRTPRGPTVGGERHDVDAGH